MTSSGDRRETASPESQVLQSWLGSLVKVRRASAGAFRFSFQDDVHIIRGVVEDASLIQELTLVLNLHPVGQYVGVSGVIYVETSGSIFNSKPLIYEYIYLKVVLLVADSVRLFYKLR